MLFSSLPGSIVLKFWLLHRTVVFASWTHCKAVSLSGLPFMWIVYSSVFSRLLFPYSCSHNIQLNWFNCKAHRSAAELSGARSFCNLKYKCNNAVWKPLSLKKLHWFIFLKMSRFHLAACVMTHNKTCFKSIKKFWFFLHGISRRI